MSGPINRLALGLLGLLDVRGAGGTYPTMLADFAQPTIDLTTFYRAQEVELITTGSLPLTVVGNQSFLQVPGTERWFVHDYMVRVVDLGADQLIDFAAIYMLSANLQPAFRLDEYQVADGALALNSPVVSTAHYGMPRVLGPGKILGASIRRITVGVELNVDMEFAALITRLIA